MIPLGVRTEAFPSEICHGVRRMWELETSAESVGRALKGKGTNLVGYVSTTDAPGTAKTRAIGSDDRSEGQSVLEVPLGRPKTGLARFGCGIFSSSLHNTRTYMCLCEHLANGCNTQSYLASDLTVPSGYQHIMSRVPSNKSLHISRSYTTLR